MESSPFLKEINSFGVTEQEGATILVASSQPIASRNTSTTDRREPAQAFGMEENTFKCAQTNFDTMIPYTQLDAGRGTLNFRA